MDRETKLATGYTHKHTQPHIQEKGDREGERIAAGAYIHTDMS